ncbi:hypothetical protein LWI29_019227 [Acer saccharum]|uniref:Uncharacterized protein n=1 Tax=Acer saccharum TaxID=4024 RepID=A0AA39T510_ACESA|nr:hypothetical protein LWI29_019227 [Acer saccharum]
MASYGWKSRRNGSGFQGSQNGKEEAFNNGTRGGQSWQDRYQARGNQRSFSEVVKGHLSSSEEGEIKNEKQVVRLYWDVPHGKDWAGRLEVVVDKKVFQVSVEMDKSPIELKWLEEHLGLDSNEGGSSSIPFQESQFKSRGYFANVPSTNSSSSARVVEYGKKVSIIQRSSSDIPEREVVSFETRQGRKVNTGLTNLSHIEGHPEKSSVGVLCQGMKEKGKKVWLRRPKSKPTRSQNLNSKLILEKGDRGNVKRGYIRESSSSSSDSEDGFWGREVIEQGVALGYNFNRRAREEESESEGEEEDLNMEEGEVQATVVTKSKGRKKTQAVKKHGMQTRNSAIR